MRSIFLLFIGCFFSVVSLIGNDSSSLMTSPLEFPIDTIIPKVFTIGEHEAGFERLMKEHEMMLLSACDNDMEIAFSKWSSMLVEMEAYSEVVNFDLQGIKIWLNIFWEEDGFIKHIAYHLKPQSKNVDKERLKLFFISFMNNYQFPMVAGEKFSHYGIASFPTFTKMMRDKAAASKDPIIKDSVNSSNKK